MAKQPQFQPKTPGPAETVPSDRAINFDDLTVTQKDRLLQTARKQIEEEIGAQLRASVTAKVREEIREDIIREETERRKRRVVGFLNEFMKHADRVGAFLPKEVIERDPCDELVDNWPGTVTTRNRRMTVIGLISSIAYNLTCDENGQGGGKLVAVMNPQNRSILGWAWKDGPEALRKEYKADPANAHLGN